MAFSSQYFVWLELVDLTYIEVLVHLLTISFIIFVTSFSLSEIYSFFPFFGGLYAIIRPTLGNYWSFITGSIELITYSLFNSLTLYFSGRIIHEAMFLDNDIYLIYIWLVICASTFIMCKINFSILYKLILFIGFYIVALYLVILIKGGEYLEKMHDFEFQFNSENDFFLERVKDPFCFFFPFLGVLILCSHCKNPKTDSPKILLTSAFFFIILPIISITYIFSMYPTQYRIRNFLVFFQPIATIFGNSNIKKIPQLGLLILFPQLYSFMTFSYIQARAISYLSESNFFLPWFHLDSEGGPQLKTYFLVMVLSFLITLISLKDDFYMEDLYTLISVFTYFLFAMIMLSCFIYFKRFSALKREFKSPLGLWGPTLAIFACIYLTFCCIFFNDNYEVIGFTSLGVFVFFTFCFYFYVRKYQKFNMEEQKILLTAYVINANKNKKMRKKINYKPKTVIGVKLRLIILIISKLLALISNPFSEKINFENESQDTDLGLNQSKISSPSHSSKNSVNNQDYSTSDDSLESKKNNNSINNNNNIYEKSLWSLTKELFSFSPDSPILPTHIEVKSPHTQKGSNCKQLTKIHLDTYKSENLEENTSPDPIPSDVLCINNDGKNFNREELDIESFTEHV